MANFTQYQCDTCLRKTEQLNNSTHATLTKCNITYKCTGTLIKLGESDTKTLTSNTASQTLQNWVARGTSLPSGAATSASSQVTVNSGQGVLAIAINQAQASATSLTLSFEIKQVSNNSFVEYQYTRGTNVSLVTGQDDSSKRLSLRFANGSNPDILVVYVNGVQLANDLFDRSVAGRITFNPILTSESNLIRVLVYSQVQASYTNLVFTENSTLLENTSAWGNVDTVEIPKGTVYKVYSCIDVSSLKLNTLLVLKSITIGGVTYTGGFDGYLLRAHAPYSNFDRDVNHVLSFNQMMGEQQMINYKNDSINSPKFFVDADTPQSMFPPIVLGHRVSPNIVSSVQSSSNTILENSYIT